MENKLNVILDLDNTIINALSSDEKLKVPLKTGLIYRDWVPYYRVYARPGLEEFLDYLFDNFNVAVFTAADKDYAIWVVNNFILTKPNRRIDFFFYRYHLDLSNKHFGGVKNLRILWDLFSVYNFFPSNTVIIDDLDYVYKTNPYNTIRIPAFSVVGDDGYFVKDSVNDNHLVEVTKKLDYLQNEYRNKKSLDLGNKALYKPLMSV